MRSRCSSASSPDRATASSSTTPPTPTRSTRSLPSARARAGGARPAPVALGPDGWDLPMLEATLRQSAPRLAYLIADHHNPTGLTLPAAQREEGVAPAPPAGHPPVRG